MKKVSVTVTREMEFNVPDSIIIKGKLTDLPDCLSFFGVFVCHSENGCAGCIFREENRQALADFIMQSSK